MERNVSAKWVPASAGTLLINRQDPGFARMRELKHPPTCRSRFVVRCLAFAPTNFRSAKWVPASAGTLLINRKRSGLRPDAGAKAPAHLS